MKNITVKDLGVMEEKSTQEIENALLAKHDAEQEALTQDTTTVKEVGVESPITEKVEEPVVEEKIEEVQALKMSDEDVLSYIGNRYGREITSLDELVEVKENTPDLPEDVLSYFNYKKETGRGIEDYVKLNKDYDAETPESLLANYYSQTEDGLDKEDIKDLMEDKFGYDDGLDDEREIRRRKLAHKRELSKAKKYFNDLKEKYKAPLESRESLPQQSDKELKAYREYIDSSKSFKEESRKKLEYFSKETEKVFNDKFKGFEFNINDKNVSYSPKSKDELKSSQSSINNFIQNYIDDKGLIKNADQYHRALSMAMNPDKYAKFFYEQGQADAIDNVSKKSKNINMDLRQAPQAIAKSGFKVRSLDTDTGRGLKIRSNKK
tara:strand:+ start:10844 stop:11980 length:1137 start_codon:yes stop_codon:yes gene_type:complete